MWCEIGATWCLDLHTKRFQIHHRMPLCLVSDDAGAPSIAFEVILLEKHPQSEVWNAEIGTIMLGERWFGADFNRTVIDTRMDEKSKRSFFFRSNGRLPCDWNRAEVTPGQVVLPHGRSFKLCYLRWFCSRIPSPLSIKSACIVISPISPGKDFIA